MSPAIAKIGRVVSLLCAGATALYGCPLYSDGCDTQNDCASGFYCDQYSMRCEPLLEAIGCRGPDECETGETCTPDRVCRPGSCDYHGCVRGYVCGVVNSAHACVLAGSSGNSDAGTVTEADAGADASLPPADASVAPTDAGNSADASP
jgi:hypothetical protein